MCHEGFGFSVFIAYQLSWVILCQSNPWIRTLELLFNPKLIKKEGWYISEVYYSLINAIVWRVFELAYYEIGVQHVSHYSMKTPPWAEDLVENHMNINMNGLRRTYLEDIDMNTIVVDKEWLWNRRENGLFVARMVSCLQARTKAKCFTYMIIDYVTFFVRNATIADPSGHFPWHNILTSQLYMTNFRLAERMSKQTTSVTLPVNVVFYTPDNKTDSYNNNALVLLLLFQPHRSKIVVLVRVSFFA